MLFLYSAECWLVQSSNYPQFSCIIRGYSSVLLSCVKYLDKLLYNIMNNYCVITNSKLNKKRNLQTQSDHLVEPEIAKWKVPTDAISMNHDGQIVSIIKGENKNISVQCQICSKVIRRQTGSTVNFLSHIKVPMYYTFITYIT